MIAQKAGVYLTLYATTLLCITYRYHYWRSADIYSARRVLQYIGDGLAKVQLAQFLLIVGSHNYKLDAIFAGHIYYGCARSPGLEDRSFDLQPKLLGDLLSMIERLFALLHLLR